jgi:NAD(P)-dependent dehydrogenase (short-subunit alcohol dehydrogenase family)
VNAPVWLVTGAGSGVGRVLAVALAAAGAEVVLTARTRARLDDTSGWCSGRAAVVPSDLADPASVDALVAEVHRHLGGRPLAGIVHAAGVMAWDSPATASGWSRVPLVNALSPWRLTQALETDLLVQPGARVLFVAGAPFTLNGVRADLGRWHGSQPGRGLSLALEAASAKVWMARVLHRRWAGRASVWAFHPGFVKSSLADGLPFPLSTLGCLAQPFLSARSACGEFLALDPAATALSGHLVDGRRAVPGCPVPAHPAGEDAWAAGLPR